MLDTLSDILTRLSVKGTLYFRTSFTVPWGVAVPSFENVARFHFAHRGDCMVRVKETGKKVLLAQGDLLIVPHGAAHDIYCGRSEEEVILPLDRVLELSGYNGEGVLVYGGEEDERETQLICGHISLARNARHLIFDQLPDYIHISNYGEAAGRWMEATLRLIGDETHGTRLGGDLIALKMTEVLFAQALRSFIEQEGEKHLGLAGFADPQLSRALAAFHKAPAREWSVEGLAREAGLSRTGFATQFSSKMGLTPMQYLTSWRIQIAQQGLVDDQMSVSEVAALAGYASESAFTRVFKKEVGLTPAAYRTSH
ncbi:AraC family transcriptional regulator [Pseudovibrio sp. Alg231-02]|uniref:AraC family transcriptional regulator n=1 Tax=Pseudovibrio sp. Alg231-02 TaxID=1922223 RepID=UPI000D55512B|nr:AraC family transcriptional regulator [Pseudovibrio sp. Alg231-02]